MPSTITTTLLKLLKSISLLILLSLGGLKLVAQDLEDLPITFKASNKSLTDVLNELGNKYELGFYFKENDLPQQLISPEFKELPLRDCLRSLLSGTSLGFTTYRDYAIIIADSRFLGSIYSEDYYRIWQERASGISNTTNTSNSAITIGNIDSLSSSGFVTIKGSLLNDDNQSPIQGANIRIPGLNTGANTDKNGSFSIEVPIGLHEIRVERLGFESLIKEIKAFSDGNLTLSLIEETITLDEVVLEAQAEDANVSSSQIGVTALEIQGLNKLPAFLGETDVFQALLLQPGVSSIGEGTNGFNVRGGNVDQNLILQDEAFIFNASHALGFFSTFNADLLGEVSLYKGNIPSSYGGRLASVLDVKLRDGRTDKFRLKGGISPVSGRISMEGPLNNGKTRFITGFRSSYSDWVLNLMNIPELQESSVFFYDANFRITHDFNDKNRLSLSAYASDDDFRYAQDFGFQYATQNLQLSYNRIFSDKLSNKLTAVLGKYQSEQEELQGTEASILENDINYWKVKNQLSWLLSNRLRLEGGISLVNYKVNPGSIKPSGPISLVIPSSLDDEKGIESAAFLESEWNINESFVLTAGMRFALYQYLGPGREFIYQAGAQPSLENILDTLTYRSGEIITSYTSPEPRISARWKLDNNSSVKFGYSRTAQFINQISNTDSPTPVQIWQLSTTNIEPQRSHNLSIGYFRNFKQNQWETSAEVYYRDMDRIFDYKDFADITLNEHIETELLNGSGRAYGLELSIKKNTGAINGFLSYTYSRTERQIAGINSGDWYPANYDRPHDVSLILNLEFNQRNSLAINFNFRSGRPNTVPVGLYILPNGLTVPDYSLRNQWRIPDYHRLDIAYTIGRGYKKNRKFNTSWTFSVFNVYGRRNPYSIFYIQEVRQLPTAQRLAILGSAFPSVTFNFDIK